ncbi:MAG TPA: OmpA family protein [Clostridiaceae bacterium]|nr:OmpA family protein [Clostridiaceae bacterium]
MRKRKRGNGDSEEGAAPWLLTYSDMVTLLLTFFVMLFSMASLDIQKFTQVSQSIRKAFLYDSSGDRFLQNKSARDLIGTTASEEEERLKNAVQKVTEEMEKLEISEYVTVIEEEEELVLRFDSVVLFELGKADILPSGQEVLLKLGSILKELDNEIIIEGHTDNLPINTLLFPTNWELSTKRATNVVLFLVEKSGLDPAKLAATGRGEFKPIRPNDTEENRSKNRRIDIIILK